MTIEGLLSNIEREKNIINEIINLNEKFRLITNKKEKEIIEKRIFSLINQLKLINNSIPLILKNISFFKEFPSKEEEMKNYLRNKEPTELLNINYQKNGKSFNVLINKKDRERFLKELKIEEEVLERLKKKKIYTQTQDYVIKTTQPNIYKKLSNKLFFNLSNSLIKKGYFKNLEQSIKKASIPFLTNSYLSMAFFSSFLSFFVVLFFIIFSYFFFGFNINYIFFILIPILIFFSFYFYPITESKSIGIKIKNEMPFIVLHMAAISSSKIEPSQIFKIIAFGKDYPYTKKEFIKVINQTNLYGYDLVTALKNVSKTTPSKELSELFSGIATIISTGGDVTEFLNKRAETLFFEYKIEREKYIKEAETLMDIYISMVIAAPMMFSLLILLMNMGVMNLSLSSQLLNFLMVGGIALINILFIIFLNLKQMNY